MTGGTEHVERRRRLAAEARRRGLAGVLIFSWRRRNLTWLTGYWPGYVTNWAAAWINADGDMELGVRFPFEAERASRQSGECARPVERPAELVPAEAERIGLVCGDFEIDETPARLLRELAAAGIATIDLGQLVSAWRTKKTWAEIEAGRKAANIAYRALQTAAAALVPGTRDFEIAGRAEFAARRAGAERALCLVGMRRGEVITEPHGRVLEANQPVGLEFTLHTSDACGHVCTTHLPDEPRDDDHHALSTCLAARAAILAELVPGRAVKHAVRAGDAILADANLLDTKEYDFGHGVGLDLPELPRLTNEASGVVEAGMLLAVHVGVRADAGPTAFVGGPVAIDEDGARELLPSALWPNVYDQAVSNTRAGDPLA